MTVEEAVRFLAQELGDDSGALVEILTAERNPATGERLSTPVIDVSTDADDEEVQLLVNQAPGEAEDDALDPFTVSALLARLRNLPGTGDYRLVSGRWVPLGDGYVGRLDMPLVGIASTDDASAIAFVEEVENEVPN